MADFIGQSLGRYHILEQLGEGGMATVYKAYDTRLETEVAVKVIRTENILPSALDRALKRFEREAKALARLTHPNIVKVTDYGEYEGKPYLVMPCLPGGTLKQKLGRPIPWHEAVQLLRPIAEALDYAHSQDMIHRDVKPSNILLTQRGQPMLTDFGIAKVLDLEETLDLTGTSAAVGTPEYMAPEQATAKTVDHRADIYALGIVFYEMVTGRKPYIADTPLAVLFKHASDPLPRPKQFVPDLPEGVEKILIKALAKNPADRYQNMAELGAVFEKLMGGQTKKSMKRESVTAETLKNFAHDKAERVYQSKREHAHTKTVSKLGWEGLLANIHSTFSFLRPYSARILFTLVVVISLVSAFYYLPQAVPVQSAIATDDLTLALQPSVTSTEGVISRDITSPSLTPTLSLTPTATALPTITLSPTATSVIIEILDEKGVPMMLVPAGEFIMGSAGESNSYMNPLPLHTLWLNRFYMDKYEVTNALYKTCVKARVCTPLENTSRYDDPNYANHPVTYLYRYQIELFCKWRGAQLPSEEQWEKAARGTDGQPYPWGEDIDCNRANYGGCVGDTTPVGSYESGVSIYGIYDMIGNVSEFTSDQPYGIATRVVRGGSWLDSDFEIHAYDRDYYDGDNAHVDHGNSGFRCAKEAVQ